MVPIGTVFAFTSIRANFPGAPDGFGQLMTTLIKPFPANLVVENKGTTLGYTILLVTDQWAYSWLSQDMYSTLPFLVIMSICVMISSLSGSTKTNSIAQIQSFSLLLLILCRRVRHSEAKAGPIPSQQIGEFPKDPEHNIS